MNIDQTTLVLPETGYFKEETKKKFIVLHHTVGGSAKSSFDWWVKQANKVSTPYLVERNGTVYQTFDPRYWSWHLGLKTGNNTIANKESIGIELASEGALRSGKDLNDRLQKAGRPRRFDEIKLYAFDIEPVGSDSSKWFIGAKKLYDLDTDSYLYTALSETWRGFNYFDAYDDLQMQSCASLVKYLCETFNIPKVLLTGDRNRFEPSVLDSFSGIITHCNVRADKTDVHPYFKWKHLELAFENN